ncbi:hypothetical protein [Sulfurovum sp.]|uniref:hypothetical protein n=1 Tax=Sulfurovum sp. TaxID=1969726 RepID=UPI0028681EC0|nr:hypothetical protein [Sulfurovum sp.]
MSKSDDEKAFHILETAVYRAQDSMQKTKHFQPFLMLLNDADEIEVFENEEKESSQSYLLLEDVLRNRLDEKCDVEIIALVVDTQIPENFADDVPNGIRIHLEEKSQMHKKLAARYLYIPYELCKVDNGEMFVKLYTPIPVGFPAEYLI